MSWVYARSLMWSNWFRAWSSNICFATVYSSYAITFLFEKSSGLIKKIENSSLRQKYQKICVQTPKIFYTNETNSSFLSFSFSINLGLVPASFGTAFDTKSYPKILDFKVVQFSSELSLGASKKMLEPQ